MNQKFRTLLVLGRVSNLPTVWSNCLAGWWLGGGGNFWKLPFLFFGVSFLYTAGMFLNDAFDEDFDRARRPERPIPSGKISVQEVWRYGFAQIILGILLLLFCGKIAAIAGIILVVLILIYDASHKFFTASPWLMGACRFWVYIIASATGIYDANGFAIFCGAALAFYIIGLSYVARRESFRGKIPHWPVIFLFVPIFLALVLNNYNFRQTAIWVSLILILWIARSIYCIFLHGEINVGRVVSNLLAGIVLVDWLAIAPEIPRGSKTFLVTLLFLALFGLTKLLQKFVPAT
jgi:4-hydroxybenzoate polyprenyltransferase